MSLRTAPYLLKSAADATNGLDRALDMAVVGVVPRGMLGWLPCLDGVHEQFYVDDLMGKGIVSDADRSCARCGALLPDEAEFCPKCGVSVDAAVTGEYELYDLDRFFTYALDMLCIASVDGYFKRVNPAFERTLGYTAEELLSIPFVELIHPDDRGGTLTEVGKLASGAPTLAFENRYLCKDGSYKDLHWTSYPEPGTGLLYAVARDVTAWKRQSDRVDRLTGLASRRRFEDTLLDECKRSRRVGSPMALAVFDVDNFRAYNERYGLQQGDDCLRKLAGSLTDRARRAGDLVARYAGQQFALLMQGGLSAAEAAKLCDHVRASVERLQIPHLGAGQGFLTVSVGTAAFIPTDLRDHHVLLASAQRALSEAKRQGRNRVVAAPDETS